MTYPYDDKLMTYSRKTHRYTLTEQGAMESLNIDIASAVEAMSSIPVIDRANAAQSFLDRISAKIYQHIYDACPPRKWELERDMAKEPEYRDIIMNAMLRQVMYELENGDISSQAGINVDTGMNVSIDRLEAAEIDRTAHNMIVSSGLYSNAFRLFSIQKRPSYEEEEY